MISIIIVSVQNILVKTVYVCLCGETFPLHLNSRNVLV